MREYRLDALVQLCQALLPRDPSLAAEVALASCDAPAYHARFHARLEDDRGIGPYVMPAMRSAAQARGRRDPPCSGAVCRPFRASQLPIETQLMGGHGGDRLVDR